MNIQKEKGESRFATLAPHIPGTRTREPSTFNFSIDHQIYLFQLKLQHIHHSHLRDPNIFIKLFHISNETWALLVRLAWPISTRARDLGAIEGASTMNIIKYQQKTIIRTQTR